MVQSWIADLPTRTGRTLDQWLDLIHAEGPPDEKALRGWLKAEHGFGTNIAWWLAGRAGARPRRIRPSTSAERKSMSLLNMPGPRARSSPFMTV